MGLGVPIVISIDQRCHHRYRRRGVVLIYITVMMMLLIGFVSLAVDFGRVELAKTELQQAADAAARAAVSQLSNGVTATQSAAVTWGGYNTCDGTAVAIDSTNDIDFGTWDTSARTFTVLTGSARSGANAVRVRARRTNARGTGLKLWFASIIGQSTSEANAVATAYIQSGSSTTYVAPATGDPWLAGMPAGTTGNWYDTAPNDSPTKAPVTLTPGQTLQFHFTGSAGANAGENATTPDGDTGWIINNYAGNEHGIANLNAPISSVVAVFLDDSQPDSTAAPASLDFSTAASRDFSTLSPLLKQPFFIGDGLRADGTTLQNFVVPAGATRLFIGIMDGQQWNDNHGGYTSTVTKAPIIFMVK